MGGGLSWASRSYREALPPVSQASPSFDITAMNLGLEKRVSQSPGIGGKGLGEATSLLSGGEEAAGSRSAGAGEWVGRREGEGGREEGGEARKMPLPGAGRGRGSREGLPRCLVGAGAAISLIWRSGVQVPGWGRHLPTSSLYHSGRRGGDGGQGTAEPYPERDANRQTWEKVNKGHAPYRRPAGAHPPLRPPPVHFHSPGPSPLPDSCTARSGGGGEGCPRPQPALPALGLHTLHTHLERVSPARPKQFNLCRTFAHESRTCCPRVQRPRAPKPERGRQGGDRGPRKVSGTGPAAREPIAGSCAPAQPGSAPGRAAYQQNETRGDRKADSCSESSEPLSPATLPVRTGLAAAPPLGRSSPGKLQPRRAPARPRPHRRPGGALPQSLIKKVAKLTLPKVVVACVPLSFPAMYSLKQD